VIQSKRNGGKTEKESVDLQRTVIKWHSDRAKNLRTVGARKMIMKEIYNKSYIDKINTGRRLKEKYGKEELEEGEQTEKRKP
jgi:hypothetical protein